MQFDTVQLLTSRINALEEFYGETLELSVIRDDGGIDVRVGVSTLEFRERSGGCDREPFYHYAINVPAHRFDDAVNWLADRVQLLADDTGTTRFSSEFMNSQQSYFADPAGNIGELIARHDHPVPSSGPFDGGELLEIGEVGLPVRDVPNALGEFEEHLSLRPWNEPNDIWCVGTDRAMFIVVPVDRGWFPIGTPAEVHPVTAELRDGDEPTGTHTVGDLPYRVVRSR